MALAIKSRVNSFSKVSLSLSIAALSIFAPEPIIKINNSRTIEVNLMAKGAFAEVEETAVQKELRKPKSKVKDVVPVPRSPEQQISERVIRMNEQINLSFQPTGTISYTDLDGNRRTASGSFANVGNASGRATFAVWNGRSMVNASSLTFDVASSKMYALLNDGSGKTVVIDTMNWQPPGGQLQFNYTLNNRTYPVILQININTAIGGIFTEEGTFNGRFGINVPGGDQALSSLVTIRVSSGVTARDQGVRGALQISQLTGNPNNESYLNISKVYYAIPRALPGVSSEPKVFIEWTEETGNNPAQWPTHYAPLRNDASIFYRVGTGNYRAAGPRIELGL